MAKRKPKPVVKVRYERCEVFVVGTTMRCPLCGVQVQSGERHECSRPVPTR